VIRAVSCIFKDIRQGGGLGETQQGGSKSSPDPQQRSDPEPHSGSALARDDGLDPKHLSLVPVWGLTDSPFITGFTTPMKHLTKFATPPVFWFISKNYDF
jgi:hypothetical protein